MTHFCFSYLTVTVLATFSVRMQQNLEIKHFDIHFQIYELIKMS